MLWAVVAVELTIAWNNVTGVYTLESTGQLIPVIIGVVGLLRVLHGLSVEKSHTRSVDILMVCLWNLFLLPASLLMCHAGPS